MISCSFFPLKQGPITGIKLNFIEGGGNMEWLNYTICKQLVVNLPKEEILGEEVKNEPVFSKCERKPQSQLIKVLFIHHLYQS